MIPRQRTPSSAEPDFPDDDPRSRPDGIGWVTRAVFPGRDVRLRIGEGTGLRYAVVPSLDAARFLLPLASRRVTAASMLAYNALRPPRVRASRAVLGVLARVGLLGLTRAPVLTVEGGPLLWDHLAGLLGAERLHAAIGIRPPDPHHKPTLQLFDDQGRPQGYAKIGWNAGTRAMVRHEAATLSTLPPGDGDFPGAPRLLTHTKWQDREVAVIEPMPPGVRRVRRPDNPRTAAMLAVARRGGSSAEPAFTGDSGASGLRAVTPRAHPFGESTFLATWRHRAAGGAMAAAAGGSQPTTVDDAIDALAVRDGGLVSEFGAWHGDWVPWNMARHRAGLLVWDWENYADDVPVGFDLAHQAFQTALSTRRRPAGDCAVAMDGALARHGAALGLDERQRRFVADAYLIELWLRTYELSHGGAGWNPKLHPALLHVLADRLTNRG